MTSRSADAVGRYRDRMRAKGLRPVQLWLPDSRSKLFAAECRRQSRLATAEADEPAVAALMALQDDTDWTA